MAHFLRLAIPTSGLQAPARLLTQGQVTEAKAAVGDLVQSTQATLPLQEGIEMLGDPLAFKRAKLCFDESVNRCRGEIYANPSDDALRRLDLHHLLMVAGFYARATDMHSNKVDPVRFLSGHYNYSVRRDRSILHEVNQSIFQEPTAASDRVVAELFKTERHLFGSNRLLPVQGRQWLLPGVQLGTAGTGHLRTEADLKRVLELEPVKHFGNFTLDFKPDNTRVTDLMARDKVLSTVESRWHIATLTCGPEPEGVHSTFTPEGTNKTAFEMRCHIEAAPLSWSEWLREMLLQAWVYWFAFWVLFWMVDEELITFVGLIIARYQQIRVMNAEAKKTGGRIYIASGKWH